MERLDSLTGAELKVLDLMARAHTNMEIADRLKVSLRTVECQIHSILLKLGLRADGVRDRRVSAVLIYLDESVPAKS